MKLVLPLTLEWRLTDACNLRCKYCSEYKPEYTENDYTEILSELINYAPKHIWIGGGEPTLVKQLPEIVKRIKGRINPHIGLNTNLTNIECVSGILPYIDDLIISVDTLDKKISKNYRGIDPETIVRNIDMLMGLVRESGYNVNLSVISVVFRESLLGNGIKGLNDALYEIDKNICHMFCPVYPVHHPESIINDMQSKTVFFDIIHKLEKNNRNIMIDFPEFKIQSSVDTIKCYRRYFRLQIVENKKIYSPCPGADIASPVCSIPCNCAAFIEDVLFAEDETAINGSPLKGRLDPDELRTLIEFIHKYTNPDSPGYIYDKLLTKQFINH